MCVEPGQFLQYRENGCESAWPLSWLTDEEYSLFLDNCVVACVDVVIINRYSMFLGLRRDEPAKGEWWTCGGRWMPNETRGEAARRILKRELALEIDDMTRFIDLNFSPDFVWNSRAQKPVERGCHMVSMFQALVLTDDEAGRLKRGEDWVDTKWVSLRDVINNNLGDMNSHEAIRQAALRANQTIELPGSIISRVWSYLRLP